jgi:hypothetical protein
MEPSESEDDQLQTIVEAISERSGVAIVEVSTLMDADF